MGQDRRLVVVGRKLHLSAAEKAQLFVKRSNITRSDLLLFAQRQDIKNASNIIDEVAEAVGRFRAYAETAGISDYWIRKIEKVLQGNG